MKNVASSPKKTITTNSIKIFLKFFFIFIFISNYCFASNYPLEILQPQADLNTNNRFYKAYPGLEYNVRMAVIGGEYPLTYSLTTAPSGMTINRTTGEIDWPKPSKSTTPYDVTATVTDAENTTETVSWTIFVTKDGFLFVDAVNGTPAEEGGTGTIGNPWKSMKDMYGGDSKYTRIHAFHPGEFVYWRAGTYRMDIPLTHDVNEGYRAAFIKDYKPQVWLAYPGDEQPVMQQDTAYLFFGNSGRDLYLDGLAFKSDGNLRGMGLNIASSKSNVVVRRSEFSGITGGYQGGNNALIFIKKWGVGENFTFQDNIFRDVDTGYALLNYDTTGVLVEDNLFKNIGDHPVGMKFNSKRWDVRGNRFRDNPRNSVELHYEGAEKSFYSGDIEIRFNAIENGGGRININQGFQKKGVPVYIYRNTIIDDAEQKYATTTNGPFYWYNNVIINDSTSTDKIDLTHIKDQSRVIVKDNLTGSLSDMIVDSQGNLTEEYADFIGRRGYQLGNQPSPIVLQIDK